jgi:hypothetical protein
VRRHRLTNVGAKSSVVERAPRHPHGRDLGGQEAGRGQVGERRQELPAGEIAGGPEDDDQGGIDRTREASCVHHVAQDSRGYPLHRHPSDG